MRLFQFEKVDEKVKLRRDIAKIYKEVFSKLDNFEPQEEPPNYEHSYFSFCVKSPHKKLNEWKKFYKYNIENGGDDFYAMMSTVYEEDVMKKHSSYSKWKKSCPITEQIQPRCMLFKTNYRSLSEAEQRIRTLEKNLHNYKNKLSKKYFFTHFN